MEPQPVFITSLVPHFDTAKLFFSSLFRHADPTTYLSIRAFEECRDAPPLFAEPITVGDPLVMETVAERMSQAANHPRAAVFCPPIATFTTAKGAKVADLANGLAISVECDAKPNLARQILAGVLGEPTIVVASGGEWTDPETGEMQEKVHLHYRLKKATVTDAEHRDLREARELATG